MTPIDLSPTLIIGTGLVGASVGLALSRAGVTVRGRIIQIGDVKALRDV